MIVSKHRPAGLLLALLLLLSAGCGSTPQAASIGGEAGEPAARTARPLSPPTAAPAAEPSPAAGTTAPAPTYGFRVVASYPHDCGAFTQGLVYVGDDTFYEGTGYYADSSLREVALQDGAVRRSVLLNEIAPPPNPNDPHFGEGIAVVGDYIFQLTWQSGRGFIYNRADFALVGEFSYPPAGSALPVEGWGLTTDGDRLIMSDGTANLYFVDPEATRASGVLAVTGQVTVQDAGQPVARLNELEMVGDELLANVWQTNMIARIDPASGQVRGWINLSGLLQPADAGLCPQIDVLNGIAYDAEQDRLFVTGKWWPKLFEIDLVGPISLFAPLVAT